MIIDLNQNIWIYQDYQEFPNNEAVRGSIIENPTVNLKESFLFHKFWKKFYLNMTAFSLASFLTEDKTSSSILNTFSSCTL